MSRVHPEVKKSRDIANGVLLTPLRHRSRSGSSDGGKALANGSPWNRQESLSSPPKRTHRVSKYESHLEMFTGQSARRQPVVTTSKKAVQLQRKCESKRGTVKRATPPQPTTVRPATAPDIPGIVPDVADEMDGWALDRAAALASMDAIAVTGSHFHLQDRRVLAYFAKLSVGRRSDDVIRVNFAYLHELLRSGAAVNAVDDLGQTPMHEVAREWGTDVAQFLLDHGADVNAQDLYGRAPIHVAAACDSAEMVQWLIENGADLSLCTYGELQTPLHFASRSDAIESLRVLIEAKCELEQRDYKGRTPLQVAAELDRSESVALLLMVKPKPASSGVKDQSGHTALCSMVQTMPPVTRAALDQLHRTSRVKRKQLYYLNLLEKPPPEMTGSGYCSSVLTPLGMIVRFRHLELVTHPVIKRLISVKWKQFGRTGAILQLIIFAVFLIALTVFTVEVSYEKKHEYLPLSDHWWRLFAALIVVGLFLFQVCDELMEIRRSSQQHKAWVKWRWREYERDLHYCHPKFPEEREYYKQEQNNLKKGGPAYFSDGWNLIDWLSYFLLLGAIIAHIIDIADHTETVASVHARLLCVALIIAWIRLLKVVRPFHILGPFVVILQHMIGDVLRFFFIFLVIFIPYASSFWVFFGNRSVPGFHNVSAALFSLYTITLGYDFSHDEMKEADSVMADLLTATYLALATVIGLNLFIALMSDTFQRVYDNAKANAYLLKANTILSLEDKLTNAKLNAYRREIYLNCAPLEEFYDDDENEAEDLKKITIQTYEEVSDIKSLMEEMTDETQREMRERALDLRLGAIEKNIEEVKATLRRLANI